MKDILRFIKYAGVLVCLASILSGCATTEKDWHIAKRMNTVAGYESFIIKHPDSDFEKQAHLQIIKKKWDLAAKQDSRKAYNDFIKENPEGEYSQKAAARIQEIDFKQVKTENTIEACKKFLETYPESPKKGKVQEQLSGLLNTGLMQAVNDSRSDEVQRMLSLGADPNYRPQKGEFPLLISASKGLDKIAGLLIQYGADKEAKDDNGDNALILACKNQHINLVALLLEKGADPNAGETGKKNYGSTALHIAANSGSIPMAKMLFEAGADINGRNSKGSVVLFYAAQKNDLDMVKWLLNHGADINAVNDKGLTALMVALKSEKDDVADYLINKGVSVKQADKDGQTVLMYAAGNSSLKMVNKLIDKGADINAIDKYSQTAFNYSKNNQNKDVYKMFSEKRYNQWKREVEKANTPFEIRVVRTEDIKFGGKVPKIPLVGVVVDITGMDESKPVYLYPLNTQLILSGNKSKDLEGMLLMSISKDICAELTGILINNKFGLAKQTFQTSPSGPYYDGSMVIKQISGGFSIMGGGVSASPGSIMRIILKKNDGCNFDEKEDLTLVTYVLPKSEKEKQELQKYKADKVISLLTCGSSSTRCGAVIYAPENKKLRICLIFEGTKNNAHTLRIGKKRINLKP